METVSKSSVLTDLNDAETGLVIPNVERCLAYEADSVGPIAGEPLECAASSHAIFRCVAN